MLTTADAGIRVGLVWLSTERLDYWAGIEGEAYEVVPVKGLGSEGRERAGGSACGGLGAGEMRRSSECERHEETEGRHGYRKRKREG